MDTITKSDLDSTRVLLKQRFSSRQFNGFQSRNLTQSNYRYEFQVFGDRLTRELDDEAHRGLYMKLAKYERRDLLESALTYVKGARVRSKAKVFMARFYALKKAYTAKSEPNPCNARKSRIYASDELREVSKK